MHQSSPTITNSHLTVSSNKNLPVKQAKKRSSNTHKHRTGETVKKERKQQQQEERKRERKKMRIFNSTSVVSAFLLSAAVMTNAFTPINIIKHTNINKNSNALISSSSGSSNSCIVLSSSALEEQQPCDMPSDMEEIDGTLKNSNALRNAIVTNVDGEQIALGDMLGLEKDKPMTSVVVFLRHMG